MAAPAWPWLHHGRLVDQSPRRDSDGEIPGRLAAPLDVALFLLRLCTARPCRLGAPSILATEPTRRRESSLRGEGRRRGRPGCGSVQCPAYPFRRIPSSGAPSARRYDGRGLLLSEISSLFGYLMAALLPCTAYWLCVVTACRV